MREYVIVNVKMPAADYHAQTGSYLTAVALIAEHGGQDAGGGTCLITGESDIDAEVPAALVSRFTAALDSAGLQWACRS